MISATLLPFDRLLGACHAPFLDAPTLDALTACIRPVDDQAGAASHAYLDTLTKPPGSLGKLEALAIQLSVITGQMQPDVNPTAIIVFAADHGVAAEGVSAFGQEVTAQMVANFAAGGAAINVFSRRIGARLEVVDVGVAGELGATAVNAKAVGAKVRRGTANMVETPAMHRDEAIAALEAGVAAARRAFAAGCHCLIVGEMGIANTTAASAMLAVLSGHPAAGLVGAGTGINSVKLTHKISVVERGIEARQCDANDPVGVLAGLGGLEIGAMAGAYLAGAAQGVPCVVDGFIATVAALLACALCPRVRGYLIFGHRSQEPGHGVALALLVPILLALMWPSVWLALGAIAVFGIAARCALLRAFHGINGDNDRRHD